METTRASSQTILLKGSEPTPQFIILSQWKLLSAGKPIRKCSQKHYSQQLKRGIRANARQFIKAACFPLLCPLAGVGGLWWSITWPWKGMRCCYSPVYLEGIPWQSSVWDFGILMKRAQVQSLVGELRSRKLCGAVKKRKKDGPWKRYARWNKPERYKRTNIVQFFLHETHRAGKLLETESKLVVARRWEEEASKVIANGHGVILRRRGGDGGQIMKIFWN